MPHTDDIKPIRRRDGSDRDEPFDVGELEDPFGRPLRHLRRIAPPWAAEDTTVCGRPANDVASIVDWSEAQALVNKWGQKRSQFLFCGTCLAQHRRKGAAPQRFEKAPAQVTSDWAERAVWKQSPDAQQARAELLALADLVDAHRDEYSAKVSAHLGDELTARRKSAR